MIAVEFIYSLKMKQRWFIHAKVIWNLFKFYVIFARKTKEYLSNRLFENDLTKFAAIRLEKSQKANFFSPDKLENQSHQRRKRKREKDRANKKKGGEEIEN